MGGWVCYIMVSDLLVEAPVQYRVGLLVRVSGLRFNFDHGIENIRRNGIVESTYDLDRQRSIVRGSKDCDHPPSNSRVIAMVGLGEI
jgi:hypothetical protein